MKIKDYRNNCCPRALQIVSGESDEHVLEVCLRHGFNNKGNGGMNRFGWLAAAEELGLGPVQVNTDKTVVCGSGSWAYDYEAPMTLGEFCKTHKSGVHLVQVRGHLLVVNQGCVVDPNYGRRAARRRVYHAYLVDSHMAPPRPEGPLPKDPLIRFVHTTAKAKRYGTDAYWRHATAWTGEDTRLSVVLANAQVFAAEHGLPAYTRKDFRADLRKGHVVIVPEHAGAEDDS